MKFAEMHKGGKMARVSSSGSGVPLVRVKGQWDRDGSFVRVELIAVDRSLQYVYNVGHDGGDDTTDEEYVSGRFVGERHEGAVGIPEHPDLAAGWGALR